MKVEAMESGNVIVWRPISRGISSIVANMVLVLIMISAGTLLVAWTEMSIDDVQDDIGSWLTVRSEAVQESLNVEMVYFREDIEGKYILLYIRNYGVIDLNLSAVYVNGALEWAGSESTSIQISEKDVISKAVD